MESVGPVTTKQQHWRQWLWNLLILEGWQARPEGVMPVGGEILNAGFRAVRMLRNIQNEAACQVERVLQHALNSCVAESEQQTVEEAPPGNMEMEAPKKTNEDHNGVKEASEHTSSENSAGAAAGGEGEKTTQITCPRRH